MLISSLSAWEGLVQLYLKSSSWTHINFLWGALQRGFSFLFTNSFMPLLQVEEVKKHQHCLAFSSSGPQSQTYYICFDNFTEYLRWLRQASKVRTLTPPIMRFIVLPTVLSSIQQCSLLGSRYELVLLFVVHREWSSLGALDNR